MNAQNDHSRPSVLNLALLIAAFSGTFAFAQAPPGPEFDRGLPKVGLFGQLLGRGANDGEQVHLSASFTVNKATRRGTLTVTAIIGNDWHIYSLTQPAGGPGKSELKITKSPSYGLLGQFQP